VNLTIASVQDIVRPWKTGRGDDMVSIKIQFANGKVGEVTAKADNKDKRIAEMKAIIGQAGEFEVDEGDGKFPMKVKSWPGKVAFGAGGGGGGGKGWTPKSIEERNEIIAQSCLNAAVATANGMLAAHLLTELSYVDGWVTDLQDRFFANTIRLARGSEAVAAGPKAGDLPRSGSIPPAASVAASEHQSAPGEGPVGEGGQPAPGADTTSVVPPAPGSVGGASGGPPPGAEAEGAADTGQAATDENPEWERLNRKAHAIARGLARDDESSHDALKRIWKPYLGGRSLTAVTAEELRSWMPDLEVLARSGG
jgi:hypothetical protein